MFPGDIINDAIKNNDHENTNNQRFTFTNQQRFKPDHKLTTRTEKTTLTEIFITESLLGTLEQVDAEDSRNRAASSYIMFSPLIFIIWSMFNDRGEAITENIKLNHSHYHRHSQSSEYYHLINPLFIINSVVQSFHQYYNASLSDYFTVEQLLILHKLHIFSAVKYFYWSSLKISWNHIWCVSV